MADEINMLREVSISCNTYAHFDYQERTCVAVKAQIFIPTRVHTFLPEI
jgi:hypothetical protein